FTCIASNRLRFSEFKKLVGKYSFFIPSSRFDYSSFHIVNPYLSWYTAQLIKNFLHPIEKAFLIFSRQWNSISIITKGKCHDKAMNIYIFTIFHCLHEIKIKLVFSLLVR